MEDRATDPASALALEPLEARLLGVLIEKELTTPEQYPLTLHSLLLGANQKSNRDPVLELSELEVRGGLEHLRRKGLIGAAHASGARVERYRHQAAVVLGLEQPEIAILAELLLRGAQTPGDLRARASRMSPFDSQVALATALSGLAARGLVEKHAPGPGERAPTWSTPLVVRSPRGAERAPEPRSGAASSPEPRAGAASSIDSRAGAASSIDSRGAAASSIEQRLAAIEAELARLVERLDGIELGAQRTESSGVK